MPIQIKIDFYSKSFKKNYIVKKKTIETFKDLRW